jgi:hypothetical protein
MVMKWEGNNYFFLFFILLMRLLPWGWTCVRTYRMSTNKRLKIFLKVYTSNPVTVVFKLSLLVLFIFPLIFFQLSQLLIK